MKLALFSPLNPQKSGIADYTEELLPHLAEGIEIDLYLDGFRPQKREIARRFRCFDYRNNPRALHNLGNYDARLYHMGNNYRYHTGIYEAARAHPGVIVFHDFALQDFFLGMARDKADLNFYLDEVEACDGSSARSEAAEALERGAAPPYTSSSPNAWQAINFPLNCRLANASEGIIVHSEWNARRLEEIAPSVPIRKINHHVTTRYIAEAMRRTEQEEPAGNANKTIQIASFGLVTPDKGIEQILYALSSIRHTHDFHYTLVGEPSHLYDIGELVRTLDLKARVRLTNRISLEEFERLITETDIAVNLRTRTMGETSGSLCRIMAAGVPSIVSNTGWFAELPDDAVIKVDTDDHLVPLLAAYLARLIDDAELRLRIGANARRHMLAEHSLEQSATDYLDFIKEVTSRRASRHFIGNISTQISQLKLDDDEDFLNDIASRVAELTAAGSSNGDHKQAGGAHNTSQALRNQTSLAGANDSEFVVTQKEMFPIAQRAVLPSPAPIVAQSVSKTVVSNPAQPNGRLPKIEGIDYKRAAIEYIDKLNDERLHYLLTKPFYNFANVPPKHQGLNGMDEETHRHFCDFANMAVALDLPAGARILDVGCGPGWLSEYFARLGYDVTGIDVSPELIRRARERVRNVPYTVDHETHLRCRFITHDAELSPLDEKFDAIICYDAMHHFEDEHAVARNFSQMLNVGGVLFILEGNKPPAGSETEALLIDAMHKYHALESPFDPAYLRRLLVDNSFAIIGDYVSVNGLYDRDAVDANNRVLVEVPETNYLLCKKTVSRGSAVSVPDSRAPNVLRADFTLRASWTERFAAGAKVELPLTIENTGDTLWLGGKHLRRGAVMLGVRILNEAGDVIREFHGQPPLPRAVAPKERAEVVIACSCPLSSGSYKLKIDLVDEYVSWFEEHGSLPLVLPLEIE
ncbi:MAG: methyltransferase domain-containing protein [Pyrinomonadaceae bacterium]|nr:methyltransferase domain-containing protein [Pyrinomonadaceae bacterium]